MTRTSQLDAHYAVIQLNALHRDVVLSFQPTVDMLVAEVRERLNDERDGPAAAKRARNRLAMLLARYRSTMLQFADVLIALRAQCGTDAGELPDGDDDVPDEQERIRKAHLEHLEKLAAEDRWLDDTVEDARDDLHTHLFDDGCEGVRI
jgi:hypothetical protein